MICLYVRGLNKEILDTSNDVVKKVAYITYEIRYRLGYAGKEVTDTVDRAIPPRLLIGWLGIDIILLFVVLPVLGIAVVGVILAVIIVPSVGARDKLRDQQAGN